MHVPRIFSTWSQQILQAYSHSAHEEFREINPELELKKNSSFIYIRIEINNYQYHIAIFIPQLYKIFDVYTTTKLEPANLLVF